MMQPLECIGAQRVEGCLAPYPRLSRLRPNDLEGSDGHMSHKSMLGVCIVSVLAFAGASAVAVSSASAGTYYWCVSKTKGNYEPGCSRAAKPGKGKAELEEVRLCRAAKHGKYVNNACTTRSAKAGKGRYEKVAGPTFTASSGEMLPTTPDLGSGAWKCKASTTTGEITGPKTSTERITFTGCESEGLPFESAGPNSTPSGKAGVIITNLLDGRLIDHGDEGPSGGEPATGEVWDALESSEHKPYVVEYNQAGTAFLRTIGTISGVFTAGSVGTLTTATTELLEKGKGEQDLGSEALTESGWLGPFPTNWQFAGGESITTTPAVEIRS